MSTVAVPGFNPFTFANRLKEAGVPEQQAAAEAEALHDAFIAQTQAVSALESKVMTLEGNAKRDAEHMATKADIALLEAKIAIARRDTIIWLGGISIAGFSTVIGVLFKLIG